METIMPCMGPSVNQNEVKKITEHIRQYLMQHHKICKAYFRSPMPIFAKSGEKSWERVEEKLAAIDKLVYEIILERECNDF